MFIVFVRFAGLDSSTQPFNLLLACDLLQATEGTSVQGFPGFLASSEMASLTWHSPHFGCMLLPLQSRLRSLRTALSYYAVTQAASFRTY